MVIGSRWRPRAITAPVIDSMDFERDGIAVARDSERAASWVGLLPLQEG